MRWRIALLRQHGLRLADIQAVISAMTPLPGAREFLDTDVMLSGIAVIGAIGLVLEKFVFQKIEDYTVVRWGMMTS